MVEQTGHCPYLGLKQNQAIRFASPTPEHRCYASGQAQEIPLVQPDYQTAFCLSPNHIKCPLYTGSGMPSTPVLATTPQVEPLLASASGLRGWLTALAPRDRAIYALLLGLLAMILVTYAVAGVGLLREGVSLGGAPPSAPAPTGEPGVGAPAPVASATPSHTATAGAIPALPTARATPRPTATPSATPTETPLPTIEAVTATPEPPTAIPAPPIYIPPPLPPTATNTATPLEPITPEVPTETLEPGPTSGPEEPPVETPILPFPTEAPTEVPTAEPTEAPTAEPAPPPTEAPAAEPAPPPTEGPTPQPARTPGP